jgi:hypothetical protein
MNFTTHHNRALKYVEWPHSRSTTRNFFAHSKGTGESRITQNKNMSLRVKFKILFETLKPLHVKGIVSRDWGRLQMGSFDRSEFRMIPLEVYF